MSRRHPITRLLDPSLGPRRVVGLMSGTSLDGIDAALVEITGRDLDLAVTLLAFETLPYSAEEVARIHALLDAPTPALSAGNFWLGGRFAEAALAVIARAGLSPQDIDLVGSHGQTVWHAPPSSGAEVPSTLQLGEAAVIAERTGILTISDFRVADVAAGGEGAPLVPFVDWLLHRTPGKRRALQNIGGIANVTLLDEDPARVVAFDNAPGNMMIDVVAERLTEGRDKIDRDGALSAAGRVQDDLLARLLHDDYLRRPPPKSTGRERYGRQQTLAWIERNRDRRLEDLLATAVAFTAEAIADSYRRFLSGGGALDEVVVSGGGAHNRTLMTHLARAIAPARLVPASGLGIDVDAKEAVAFAVLALRCLEGLPGNLPSVTGARHPAVLGKLTLPPTPTLR